MESNIEATILKSFVDNIFLLLIITLLKLILSGFESSSLVSYPLIMDTGKTFPYNFIFLK